MTVGERVAAFLVKNKGKACNACLAEELGINHRQAGNATLALAESGRFVKLPSRLPFDDFGHALIGPRPD